MPYRTRARTSIGPASIRRFDPANFLDQTSQTVAIGSSATLAAQQRAAERRIEAQEAAIRARQLATEQTQRRIQARVTASQNRIQGLQGETSTKLAQIARYNARLARQQSKLGAAYSYQNPAFRGNANGPLTAVGPASKKAAGIINEALKYRGRMYQWGGSTPKTSFDCSGLVQWAYKSMGIGLPRVSADQARAGRKVPLQSLRPGDLVAWDNSSRNNGADHIAIYIGNGQIIEAPRTGVAIRVRALGNEQNAWGVQILQ